MGQGPRACEKALLSTVAEELEESDAPQRLSRPLYLLVPSHSLRSHILDRLVRQRRGYAGLSCVTLRALARDILERCGETPLTGSWMLPILVQRAAREQAPLRSCLDHLHDGYATLNSAVTDLLEAGLDPAHADAIDEVLAEEGRLVATVAEVQRSRSLIKVAIQVQTELIALGLGHSSTLLQRATELLRTRPDLRFPCSGFHVFGFADATGVATDLIEAVLLRLGGTVYLDHPPDPTRPDTEDPSFEFSRRFATRLADLGRQDQESTVTADPPQIQLVSALGGQAEIRDVGWRIRRLLDDGYRPEDIGIVARRLDPYRSGLRTHLQRLGVPYSAAQTSGPLLPKGRRIRALLEVMTRRQRARLERWLDARTDSASTVPAFDLRLAMFGLGVGRIDELASLHREDVLQRETYALPVRLGYSIDDDDSQARLARRHVPTEALRQARDQARDLCQLFESWVGDHSWSRHLDFFDRLLALLGWSASDPVRDEIQNALDRLSQGIPPSLRLDIDELTRTVTDALKMLGSDRLGGFGGGVQILDVTEARGRTFAHLFVLGLNKGVFPRSVREDPALSDDLRHVLGREGHGVLPDLPLKRAGFAEERFLFAQLCSASPHVTLSWQVADDDNREVSTSPLVERLLWTRDSTRVSSPQTIGTGIDDDEQPRTGFESAIRAALIGSTRQIKAALAHAQFEDLSASPQSLAAARLGIVAEFDRPPGPKSQLGPYFGFVGAALDPLDPRRAFDLYVTTLERFAVCPWRTYLERLLRLEALPDPVEVLPSLDAFLIGQLVHRVLEKLVGSHLHETPLSLDQARQSEPVEVPWPRDDDLSRLVLGEAIAVTRAQGITWEGFADVLARVALPFLDQARDQIWNSPDGSGPVAVEMSGSLPIGSGASGRLLHFKADRVDSLGGSLLLSDYKTSRRGISDAKTQKTRDKHLVAEISKGRLLQAAAYARASGQTDDQGRYVFLHPEFKGDAATRIVPVTVQNEAAQEAFDDAVNTLTQAWFAGVFFPRLVEPDIDTEPRACDYCNVAEACLRGDSSLRGRLRDWSARNQAADETDQAFLDAWYLASTRESRR